VGGLVLQSCGTLVVAGTVSLASGGPEGFGLVRYTADGAVDPTFGTSGRTTTAIGDAAYAFAAARRADGKTLVGGATSVGGTWSLALARYSPEGNLDPSFGTGGVVVTALPDGGFIDGLTVQPNGSILVSGGTLASLRTWFLARYEGNGALDGSFGTGGLVMTGLSADGGYALAVQSNGSIVGTNGSVLARFDELGAADSSFGVGGIVAEPFGSSVSAQVFDVKVLSDGSILAAGGANGTDSIRRLAAAHFSSSGEVDAGFGSAGAVITDLGGHTDSVAWALTIDSIGRILAVGQAGSNVATVRLSGSGAIDASFGSSGAALLAFGGPTYPAALTLQPDGRIVIAAAANSILPASPVVLARYVP
jgi:uncharacterized delta-60 repeat protein